MKTRVIILLGLLSFLGGCGFVPMRQILLSPGSSSQESASRPGDLISAQLDVALKCLKPGAQASISPSENKECQSLARQAYYLFPVDWQDPDDVSLFVNSLAFQIIRTSTGNRYKEIIERLATQDILTHRLVALQILNTTQLYWQSYFKTAFTSCRVHHPQRIMDQKALTSMMTAMAMTSFLPGSNLTSVVPRYFRAFAVYAASLKLVDWTFPRLPFTQPRNECKAIPPAPAEIIFYGNAAPRFDDVNTPWLLDQLKEDELKYSEVSLLTNLALAIPIEMTANPTGFGAKVSQEILNSFATATRWARSVAYIGSSAVSFAYVTAIFLILDQGVQYGLNQWQQADLFKAFKEKAASVAALEKKDQVISGSRLGEIRKLTERAVLLAHHYNQSIYSTQNSVVRYFTDNELPCSADKTRRQYQRRRVVAQMVLNELRESFDRGGQRGHQCLLDFEKSIVLSDLSQRQTTETRQALFDLKRQLAQQFAEGDYCPQGPGLLLQLTSYLDAFPEEIRSPYQAHIGGILEGLIISYKGSIEDFWVCPKPD